MNYSEKVYNKHYAYIYIKILVIITVINLISILVLEMNANINMHINQIVLLIIGALVFISILLVYPIIICTYYANKKRAKLQKQYISSNKLYVEICVEEGVTGIVYNSRWIRYVVNSIDDIHISRRYIIIDGTIDKETVDKGYGHSKKISRIKIPRVFEQEEQIINLHGGF